jgi:hypothetical protein
MYTLLAPDKNATENRYAGTTVVPFFAVVNTLSAVIVHSKNPRPLRGRGFFFLSFYLPKNIFPLWENLSRHWRIGASGHYASFKTRISFLNP